MAEYTTNEYDLKKAYYNMALNIIKSDEQCPVFSVKSIWEKYEETKIYTFNYYLIKKKSLKKLSMYGIMTNIQPGYIINFLLNKNMITLDKIKYEKKAEYTLQWSTIQNRIEKLKETLGEKIKDEYIFYNGILGRTESNHKKSIFNLTENEINLLNADYTKDKFNVHKKMFIEKETNNKKIDKQNTFVINKSGVIRIPSACDKILFALNGENTNNYKNNLIEDYIVQGSDIQISPYNFDIYLFPDKSDHKLISLSMSFIN
jgi:hypothetical protein